MDYGGILNINFWFPLSAEIDKPNNLHVQHFPKNQIQSLPAKLTETILWNIYKKFNSQQK